MENVKCPSCGGEVSQKESQCPHCGNSLPELVEIYDSSLMEDYKSRAGFVSFYLWLGAIVNSIMSVCYFLTIFTKKGMWSAYDPMYSRISGFLLSGGLALSYYMLLRWKIAGFYLFLTMATLTLIINLGVQPYSFVTFMPIVSSLILYAILQIRSDGRSCWSWLS